jgi:hypothetical protein
MSMLPIFDKAALNMARDIERERYKNTPFDPAKFNPAKWRKADLIDALRNKAMELLPAAPTRQDASTIRAAARQAVAKYGFDFTLEVGRIAGEATARKYG